MLSSVLVLLAQLPVALGQAPPCRQAPASGVNPEPTCAPHPRSQTHVCMWAVTAGRCVLSSPRPAVVSRPRVVGSSRQQPQAPAPCLLGPGRRVLHEGGLGGGAGLLRRLQPRGHRPAPDATAAGLLPAGGDEDGVAGPARSVRPQAAGSPWGWEGALKQSRATPGPMLPRVSLSPCWHRGDARASRGDAATGLPDWPACHRLGGAAANSGQQAMVPSPGGVSPR